MRARFENMNLEDYRSLVAATFSRADAWQDWLPERDIDRPLQGIREVLGVGIEGLTRLVKRIVLSRQWRRLPVWKK
jgi:cellulose synthase (UDP-forming)